MLNTRVSNFYKSFKENEKTNFLGFAELELCNEAGGAMYRVTSVGLYQRKDSNTFYYSFLISKVRMENGEILSILLVANLEMKLQRW